MISHQLRRSSVDYENSLQASVVIAWVTGVIHFFTPTGTISSIIPVPGLLGSAFDFIMDLIPWPPFDFFKTFWNAIEWLISILLTGFLDAIGFFFVAGVEYFLFYDNPRHIPELNEYWYDTLPFYLFILFAMMFAYYVMMMLLADTEDADVQRIVERALLSGIFLAVSRDIFAFFVDLTNEIAYSILPSSYSFYIGVELIEGITGAVGVTLTALFIAVFGGLSILVSGVIFYIVLAMRMLIVYVVYAIMPILLAFWVVDVGPGKYGKFFADFMFKIAAVMMILGIVIAGILAVGAGVGQDPDIIDDDVELASDYDETDDGTIIISTDEYGPRATTDVDAEGGEFSEGFSSIMFRIFIFLGTIWLTIALVTSMFGMLLSAGASSPGGTGGYSGNTSKGGGGGQYGGHGGGQQSWGARSATGTTGSAHSYELDDGRQVVTNPAGGGVVVNPNSGSDEKPWETFGPEDNPLQSQDEHPNPFNTKPSQGDGEGIGTPLSEKAGNIAGEMSDTVGSAADKVTAGQATNVAGTAKDTGGSLKSYLGAGVQKARQKAGEWTPNIAKKAGNLSKRGAKAYWNVFNEPTVKDSLIEMDRINAESPLTLDRPDPDPSLDDGPVVSVGPDSFVIGRNADQLGGTAPDQPTGPDPASDLGPDPWFEDDDATIGPSGDNPVDPDVSTDPDEFDFDGSGDAGDLDSDTDEFDVDDPGQPGDIDDDLGDAGTDVERPDREPRTRDRTSMSEMAEELDSDPEDFGFDSPPETTGEDTELSSGAGIADENDVDLPDGYDSVSEALEDYEISSPPGHDGYTDFTPRSEGTTYTDDGDESIPGDTDDETTDTTDTDTGSPDLYTTEELGDELDSAPEDFGFDGSPEKRDEGTGFQTEATNESIDGSPSDEVDRERRTRDWESTEEVEDELGHESDDVPDIVKERLPDDVDPVELSYDEIQEYASYGSVESDQLTDSTPNDFVRSPDNPDTDRLDTDGTDPADE